MSTGWNTTGSNARLLESEAAVAHKDGKAFSPRVRLAPLPATAAVAAAVGGTQSPASPHVNTPKLDAPRPANSRPHIPSTFHDAGSLPSPSNSSSYSEQNEDTSTAVGEQPGSLLKVNNQLTYPTSSFECSTAPNDGGRRSTTHGDASFIRPQPSMDPELPEAGGRRRRRTADDGGTHSKSSFSSRDSREFPPWAKAKAGSAGNISTMDQVESTRSSLSTQEENEDETHKCPSYDPWIISQQHTPYSNNQRSVTQHDNPSLDTATTVGLQEGIIHPIKQQNEVNALLPMLVAVGDLHAKIPVVPHILLNAGMRGKSEVVAADLEQQKNIAQDLMPLNDEQDDIPETDWLVESPMGPDGKKHGGLPSLASLASIYGEEHLQQEDSNIPNAAQDDSVHNLMKENSTSSEQERSTDASNLSDLSNLSEDYDSEYDGENSEGPLPQPVPHAMDKFMMHENPISLSRGAAAAAHNKCFAPAESSTTHATPGNTNQTLGSTSQTHPSSADQVPSISHVRQTSPDSAGHIPGITSHILPGSASDIPLAVTASQPPAGKSRIPPGSVSHIPLAVTASQPPAGESRIPPGTVNHIPLAVTASQPPDSAGHIPLAVTASQPPAGESRIPPGSARHIPLVVSASQPPAGESRIPPGSAIHIPLASRSQLPASTGQIPASSTGQVAASTSQLPTSAGQQMPTSTTGQPPSSTGPPLGSTTGQIPASTGQVAGSTSHIPRGSISPTSTHHVFPIQGSRIPLPVQDSHDMERGGGSGGCDDVHDEIKQRLPASDGAFSISSFGSYSSAGGDAAWSRSSQLDLLAGHQQPAAASKLRVPMKYSFGVGVQQGQVFPSSGVTFKMQSSSQSPDLPFTPAATPASSTTPATSLSQPPAPVHPPDSPHPQQNTAHDKALAELEGQHQEVVSRFSLPSVHTELASSNHQCGEPAVPDFAQKGNAAALEQPTQQQLQNYQAKICEMEGDKMVDMSPSMMALQEQGHRADQLPGQEGSGAAHSAGSLRLDRDNRSNKNADPAAIQAVTAQPQDIPHMQKLQHAVAVLKDLVNIFGPTGLENTRNVPTSHKYLDGEAREELGDWLSQVKYHVDMLVPQGKTQTELASGSTSAHGSGVDKSSGRDAEELHYLQAENEMLLERVQQLEQENREHAVELQRLRGRHDPLPQHTSTEAWGNLSPCETSEHRVDYRYAEVLQARIGLGEGQRAGDHDQGGGQVQSGTAGVAAQATVMGPSGPGDEAAADIAGQTSNVTATDAPLASLRSASSDLDVQLRTPSVLRESLELDARSRVQSVVQRREDSCSLAAPQLREESGLSGLPYGLNFWQQKNITKNRTSVDQAGRARTRLQHTEPKAADGAGGVLGGRAAGTGDDDAPNIASVNEENIVIGYQNAMEELEATKQELDRLKGNQVALHEQLQSCQQEKERSEAKLAEAVDQVNHLKKEQQQYQQQQRNNAHLQEQLSDVNKEAIQLQAHLAEAQLMADRHKQEAGNLLQAREQLLTTLDTKGEALEELQAEYAEACVKIQELNKDVKDLQRHNKALIDVQQQLMDECDNSAKLQASLQQADKKLKAYQQDDFAFESLKLAHSLVQQQVRESQARTAELEVSLAQAKSKLMGYEGRVLDSKDTQVSTGVMLEQLGEFQHENNQLRSQLTEALDVCDKYRRQLLRLEVLRHQQGGWEDGHSTPDADRKVDDCGDDQPQVLHPRLTSHGTRKLLVQQEEESMVSRDFSQLQGILSTNGSPDECWLTGQSESSLSISLEPSTDPSAQTVVKEGEQPASVGFRPCPLLLATPEAVREQMHNSDRCAGTCDATAGDGTAGDSTAGEGTGGDGSTKRGTAGACEATVVPGPDWRSTARQRSQSEDHSNGREARNSGESTHEEEEDVNGIIAESAGAHGTDEVLRATGADAAGEDVCNEANRDGREQHHAFSIDVHRVGMTSPRLTMDSPTRVDSPAGLSSRLFTSGEGPMNVPANCAMSWASTIASPTQPGSPRPLNQSWQSSICPYGSPTSQRLSRSGLPSRMGRVETPPPAPLPTATFTSALLAEVSNSLFQGHLQQQHSLAALSHHVQMLEQQIPDVSGELQSLRQTINSRMFQLHGTAASTGQQAADETVSSTGAFGSTLSDGDQLQHHNLHLSQQLEYKSWLVEIQSKIHQLQERQYQLTCQWLHLQASPRPMDSPPGVTSHLHIPADHTPPAIIHSHTTSVHPPMTNAQDSAQDPCAAAPLALHTRNTQEGAQNHPRDQSYSQQSELATTMLSDLPQHGMHTTATDTSVAAELMGLPVAGQQQQLLPRPGELSRPHAPIPPSPSPNSMSQGTCPATFTYNGRTNFEAGAARGWRPPDPTIPIPDPLSDTTSLITSPSSIPPDPSTTASHASFGPLSARPGLPARPGMLSRTHPHTLGQQGTTSAHTRHPQRPTSFIMNTTMDTFWGSGTASTLNASTLQTAPWQNCNYWLPSTLWQANPLYLNQQANPMFTTHQTFANAADSCAMQQTDGAHSTTTYPTHSPPQSFSQTPIPSHCPSFNHLHGVPAVPHNQMYTIQQVNPLYSSIQTSPSVTRRDPYLERHWMLAQSQQTVSDLTSPQGFLQYYPGLTSSQPNQASQQQHALQSNPLYFSQGSTVTTASRGVPQTLHTFTMPNPVYSHSSLPPSIDTHQHTVSAYQDRIIIGPNVETISTTMHDSALLETPGTVPQELTSHSQSLLRPISHETVLNAAEATQRRHSSLRSPHLIDRSSSWFSTPSPETTPEPGAMHAVTATTCQPSQSRTSLQASDNLGFQPYGAVQEMQALQAVQEVKPHARCALPECDMCGQVATSPRTLPGRNQHLPRPASPAHAGKVAAATRLQNVNRASRTPASSQAEQDWAGYCDEEGCLQCGTSVATHSIQNAMPPSHPSTQHAMPASHPSTEHAMPASHPSTERVMPPCHVQQMDGGSDERRMQESGATDRTHATTDSHPSEHNCHDHHYTSPQTVPHTPSPCSFPGITSWLPSPVSAISSTHTSSSAMTSNHAAAPVPPITPQAGPTSQPSHTAHHRPSSRACLMAGGDVTHAGATLKHPNDSDNCNPNSNQQAHQPSSSSDSNPNSSQLNYQPDGSSDVNPTSSQLNYRPDGSSDVNPTSNRLNHQPDGSSVVNPTSNRLNHQPSNSSDTILNSSQLIHQPNYGRNEINPNGSLLVQGSHVHTVPLTLTSSSQDKAQQMPGDTQHPTPRFVSTKSASTSCDLAHLLRQASSKVCSSMDWQSTQAALSNTAPPLSTPPSMNQPLHGPCSHSPMGNRPADPQASAVLKTSADSLMEALLQACMSAAKASAYALQHPNPMTAPLPLHSQPSDPNCQNPCADLARNPQADNHSTSVFPNTSSHYPRSSVTHSHLTESRPAADGSQRGMHPSWDTHAPGTEHISASDLALGASVPPEAELSLGPAATPPFSPTWGNPVHPLQPVLQPTSPFNPSILHSHSSLASKSMNVPSLQSPAQGGRLHSSSVPSWPTLMHPDPLVQFSPPRRAVSSSVRASAMGLLSMSPSLHKYAPPSLRAALYSKPGRAP